MQEVLAGLGKRVFLLNNVHENAPVTFETRWVLSYLRGPLTREQKNPLPRRLRRFPRNRQPQAQARRRCHLPANHRSSPPESMSCIWPHPAPDRV
jgi:hypothetical protein